MTVRLKHVTTGVVVEVSDEKAERLGSEWQPAADEPKKARASRAKSE